MSQKITLKGASHLAYLSPHSYSTLTQLLGSPAALKKWESQNQLGHCAKPTQWKTIIRNLPCLAILLYTKNQPMQAYLSPDVLPLLSYPPTNIFRIKKCHCLPSIIMSWVPPPPSSLFYRPFDAQIMSFVVPNYRDFFDTWISSDTAHPIRFSTLFSYNLYQWYRALYIVLTHSKQRAGTASILSCDCVYLQVI